jgi:Transposase DDE domain
MRIMNQMIEKQEDKLIKVSSIINGIYGEDLHKKRQLSLAHAAMGVLSSESLFLHRMAEGLVNTRGGDKKHATKQIDRLLSNKGISVWDLSEFWVSFVIGEKKVIIVALDWTSFFDDEQSMLSLNIVTPKGLATPLLWKSVDKKQLKHNRARYEDQLLSRLKTLLPKDVQVLLLADRGFADQKFFRFLDEELGFQYIIRIKSNTTIIHKQIKNKAANWLRSNGKILSLKKALLTLTEYPIEHFVAVKDKGMKSAWFLVSNTELKPREVITNYSKRWKIEPYFRDLKDGRFGLGLEQTHIKSCDRRDRLMLILALSYLLLILLGQAGESIGLDRKLKVNTVKTRTHSLFRQGQFYYKFFYRFTQEEQNNLMLHFDNLLRQHRFCTQIFL